MCELKKWSKSGKVMFVNDFCWCLASTIIILCALHISISDTAPLNVIDHLRPVRSVLWDVRWKWFNLGVELDIDEPTLQVTTACST